MQVEIEISKEVYNLLKQKSDELNMDINELANSIIYFELMMDELKESD